MQECVSEEICVRYAMGDWDVGMQVSSTPMNPIPNCYQIRNSCCMLKGDIGDS